MAVDEKQGMKFCAVCGKQLRTSRKGTMTSWIFGGNDCNCGALTPSATAVAGTRQNVRFAGGAAPFPEPLPVSRPAAPLDLSSGALPRLGERFEVLGFIGEGGMGAVYKVVERETGKIFAAKVLKRELAQDATAVKRFEQEVLAASELTHPNLIFIYGSYRTLDGAPYMVMNYIDGESLAQTLQFNPFLPPARAIPVFQQVAEALEHVHGKGIIHRDLKPSNILIYQHASQRDAVRLVDFGIAKMQGVNATGAMTQTGELFGSPYYMSPEQCGGEPLDARSDIYSLGCVMYQALSGKPPFESDNAIKTMVSHMQVEPKPLHLVNAAAMIPKSLETVVMRCLEKNPAKRYQAAADLQKDLQSVAVGRTIAKSSSPSWMLKLVTTRWKLAAALAASFSLGALCMFLLLKVPPSKVFAPPPKAQATPPTSKFAEKSALSIISSISSKQYINTQIMHKVKRVDLTRASLLDELPVDADLVPLTNVKFIECVYIDCANMTTKGLGYLPSQINTLDLEGFNFDLSPLKKLTSLNRLELRKGILGDNSMSIIAALPALHSLQLTDMSVSDADLAALKNSLVTDLDFRSCHGPSENGWRMLAKMPQLQILKLDASRVPEATIIWLEKNCPRIRTVQTRQGISHAANARDYFELAQTYKAEGWTEKSREALQRAIDADPNGIGVKARLYGRTRLPRYYVCADANALNMLASKNVKLHRAVAESEWNESITKYPDFEWPYCSLAACYLEDKRTAEAEALLKKAIDINPDYINALGSLARLKIVQKDFAAAKHYIDRISGLEPDNQSAKVLQDSLKSAAANK